MKNLYKSFFVIIFSLGIIWWLNVPFINTKSTNTINIVTATPILKNLVEEILGPEVDVTSIVSEDRNPNDYKLTSSDRKKIKSSDVIVFNGLGLEKSFGDISKLIESDHLFINIGPYLKNNGLLIKNNPYYWLSPSLWKKAVIYLNKRFTKKFPEMESSINSRTQTYLSSIDQLIDKLSKTTNLLSKKRISFIVNHHSFEYFSRDFKLKLILIQDSQSLSQTKLNYIIKTNINQNTMVVFPTKFSNQTALNQLSDVSNQFNKYLTVGPQLNVLNFDSSKIKNNNYINFMKNNATTIVDELLK